MFKKSEKLYLPQAGSRSVLLLDSWIGHCPPTLLRLTYYEVCHFILNNEYKSIAIGVNELDERHTSEYLQVQLLKVISDWNINIDT